MVATFLDSAHADPDQDAEEVDLGRPSWSETASVLALAVRVRLGGSGGSARSVLWGAALGRFALVGLLAHAALAAASFAGALWYAGQPQALTLLERSSSGGLAGSLVLAAAALQLPWLAAFLCLALGARRVGIVVAVAALVISLGRPVMSFHAYELLAGGIPVLALVAFHRDAPAVARRVWLLALPIGVVLAFLPLAASVTWPRLSFAFPDGWALALTVAAVGYLVVDHPAHVRRPARARRRLGRACASCNTAVPIANGAARVRAWKLPRVTHGVPDLRTRRR